MNYSAYLTAVNEGSERPVKLALVRQTYNPYGGAERFVERALTALAGEGLALTLITRSWPTQHRGLAVRLCNPLFVGRLWRDWGFSRRVRQIIASGEFDLVQAHERIPGCSLYRAGDGVHATWLESRARVQSRVAQFATRINLWHRYTLKAEQQMFRHPHLRAVICNSVMVKEDLMRRFGVASSKLHVIHNGVDLDHFHPGLRAEHCARVRRELGIGMKRPLILFVGSGFERKGLPQLLTAMARMRRKRAELLVVGADRRMKAMKQLAHHLGIAQRVHFLGAQNDVRPYYGAADIFALPTLYDPFPNALLEALACGLPVVTSTSCGGAELVEHGRSGYLCPPAESTALAAHLDTLVTQAPTMREAARAAATRCALPDMVRLLTGLYSQLMAESAAGL